MNKVKARNLTNEFLNKKKSSESIGTLRQVIRFHDYQYRVRNSPIIDDTTYDRLFSLLKQREKVPGTEIPEDSPTQMVGEEILSHFDKSTHRIPMLSLQNTYTTEEIYEWGVRCEKILDASDEIGNLKSISYLVEPKLDGSSVQIVYKYGYLIQAATRGNGYIGEDITQHVKRISNLPHYISQRQSDEEVVLRAEIVMPEEAFERVNEEQVRQGEKIFANARNAASGILRNLDVSLVYKRGLICYVFEVLSMQSSARKASDCLGTIQDYGIPVHPWRQTADSIQEVVSICNDEQVRSVTQFGSIACDGLVVKIDQYSLRSIIGFTEHHPRRAVAFKYPSQEVIAYLDNIERQVGRTGIITPVANLTPVSVGGVVVQKATLHNASFILDRKLKVKQDVRIKRSGEVIPYVIGPVERPNNYQFSKNLIPKKCPVCNESTIISEDYKRLLCVNLHCPSQLKEKLKHYASRDAADIEGLGGKSIELLYENGLISTIDTLYELNTPGKAVKAMRLQGVGSLKWDAIISGIEASKKRKFHEIFYGLGVNGVGRKLSKVLTQYYAQQKTIENSSIIDHFLLYTKYEKISALYGIGDEIAATLVSRISLEQTGNVLRKLEKFGVLTIEKLTSYSDGEKNISQGVYFGKTFVITGSFEVSRKNIAEYIESLGGVVTSMVSSKTDYLLVGENAGSKVNKAMELGVSLLEGKAVTSFLGSLSSKENVNQSLTVHQQKLFE